MPRASSRGGAENGPGDQRPCPTRLAEDTQKNDAPGPSVQQIFVENCLISQRRDHRLLRRALSVRNRTRHTTVAIMEDLSRQRQCESTGKTPNSLHLTPEIASEVLDKSFGNPLVVG